MILGFRALGFRVEPNLAAQDLELTSSLAGLEVPVWDVVLMLRVLGLWILLPALQRAKGWGHGKKLLLEMLCGICVPQPLGRHRRDEWAS